MLTCLDLRPIRLRTDCSENPIGMDNPCPTLRWEMPGEENVCRLAARQIQAADSREALIRGEANRWDSGWVDSLQTNEADYGGATCGSRERLWWRVRVRADDDKVGPWSEPAWWEYGLLNPEDWSARWITTNITGGPRTCAPAPYLRTEFFLPEPPVQARLYITALGLYECEINGQPICLDVLAPGWTDYRKRVLVQTFDVTALLRGGQNAIGVILGDGWYCGHVSSKDRQEYGLRPALLSQLEIAFRDGSSRRVSSDGNWSYSTGPIVENDLLMGETYDARSELGKWSSPDYGEMSEWQPVVEMPGPKIALTASASPRIRRQEVFSLHAPSLAELPEGRIALFDVLQNIAGRTRIAVRGSRGSRFRIRHGEMLDEQGALYVDNLRRARCTDYYICKGEDTELWEPRFTYHGFRYVEITAFDKASEISSAEAIAVYSDMEATGDFSCSHDLLNRLFQNIHWSLKGNFVDVPTDCPQRDERLGWTGDAQVFIPTASFLRNVSGFFSKWALDMSDAQKPNGAISSVAPEVDVRTSEDAGPGWSDAVIICPWEIYRAYGDRRILEQNFPAMQRYVEYLRLQQCKGDIRCHPDLEKWDGHGDWLAMDGGVDREGNTPKDLIGTAYLAYDLELLSRIADVLGRADDARSYRAWRENVVRAFRRRFVTEDHLLIGNTQTSYVLALHFHLLSGTARRIAVNELVKNLRKRSFHLTTGFLGTPYICQVLEDNGHLDIAYRLLEQETFPSWLFPVKNGATTTWERWDGWTPENGFQNAYMNSFNHYAYGAIGAWMVRTVAGIELDPDQPGGSHLFLRPRPGGTVTNAEARWHTVRGLAAIQWNQSDDRLELAFTIPAYSHATLLPPAGYAVAATKFGPGHHEVVLRAQKPREDAAIRSP